MFHLDSDEIWTFRLASIHFTFSSLAALTFAAVTNIVFICGKIVFQLTVVWCSSKLQLGKQESFTIYSELTQGIIVAWKMKDCFMNEEFQNLPNVPYQT